MSRASSLIAKTNRLLKSTSPFSKNVYLRTTITSGGDTLIGRYGYVVITDTLLDPQPFVTRLGRQRVPGGHAMSETLAVGSRMKIGDDYLLLLTPTSISISQLEDPNTMLLFSDTSGSLETLVIHDFDQVAVDSTDIAFTLYCRSVEASMQNTLSSSTTHNTFFSSTPSFDMNLASTFSMLLTGNVTSSSVKNVNANLCTITVKQDAVGGRTFAFPINFMGCGVISTEAGTAAPNSFATQTFAPTGSIGQFVAVGPLSYGGS